MPIVLAQRKGHKRKGIVRKQFRCAWPFGREITILLRFTDQTEICSLQGVGLLYDEQKLFTDKTSNDPTSNEPTLYD
jgi:hypothetical protein